MEIQRYIQDKHAEAVRRIWREVGWLDAGPEHEPGVDAMMAAGPTFVASTGGEIECCVGTAPGDIRHLDSTLPFICVSSVTTGRAARRQGLAPRLTAYALAQAAAQGACVAGLSIFDQGFYERVGFGPGGYEHWVAFDPAQLTSVCKAPAPSRITASDAEAAHAARLQRMRQHGSCSLTSVEHTRADMLLYKNGFGLGFRSPGGGAVSHYVWLNAEDVEHGPYEVSELVYRTWPQCLELLGVLRSLADQAQLIRMREPVGLQLQDLLDQPFRGQRVTESSKFASGIHAHAYWQMRMCDVVACIGKTELPHETVRCNLEVTDPIEEFLPAEAEWRGVAGAYMITLGPTSRAQRGSAAGLPVLRCSVGALTRLWLGVLPATSLAITDDLSGPPELLAQLDAALRLPRPSPDWDF